MKQLKEFPWPSIIPLLLTIVASNWFADAFIKLMDKKLSVSGDDWTILISLVLFVISILWLYHYRKSFLGIRTLQQVKTKASRALILFLSTPNPEPESYSFPMKIISRDGIELILEGKSLSDDIEALNKVRWNWQQILRGIKPHKDKLKYLYFIGSKDSESTKGSFNYLDAAITFIKQYCPDIKTYRADTPVDFEDLESLIDVIYQAIKRLKNEGSGEDDIIIDVTGGQKVTSIAGAVITLNSSIRFQYVQTNPPYEARAYDLTIQTAPLI